MLTLTTCLVAYPRTWRSVICLTRTSTPIPIPTIYLNPNHTHSVRTREREVQQFVSHITPPPTTGDVCYTRRGGRGGLGRYWSPGVMTHSSVNTWGILQLPINNCPKIYKTIVIKVPKNQNICFIFYTLIGVR